MRAFCQIRPQPAYRRDAFVSGLKALGYQVTDGNPAKIERDDILVIWNRYWASHDLACKFESAGARVLVAENGYIGKDKDGIQFYALALHGHNGSGQWVVGGADRLQALNLDIKPYQSNPDGHILVCGQRGIGSPTMASPAGWHVDVAKRLRAVTRRKVVIRYHPEDKGAPPGPQPSLDEQLAGAWACVIWSSSSGVKALVAGVPVFYEAPHWVAQYAAPQGIEKIEQPWRNEVNRLIGLKDVAWAQWSVAEIAAGTAFRHLLQGAA